jgi:hypothetical protein
MYSRDRRASEPAIWIDQFPYRAGASWRHSKVTLASRHSGALCRPDGLIAVEFEDDTILQI